mgnify:CR=1 FL=1
MTKSICILLLTCFIIHTGFCQTEKKLDVKLLSSETSNIKIRPMDNGDYLIFSIKYRLSEKHDVLCTIIDKDGEKKGSYSNSNLTRFIDPVAEENQMRYIQGTFGLGEMDKNMIYSSKNGNMYAFYYTTNSIKIEETSFKGELVEHQISSTNLLKPSQMLSWDMKIINDDVIRLLFLYNGISGNNSLTLVSCDYNMNDHTSTVKSQNYGDEIAGFAGKNKPRVKIIKELNNHKMLCVVSSSYTNKLCVLNADLSINYIDHSELIGSKGFGTEHVKLIENGKSGKTILALQLMQLSDKTNEMGIRFRKFVLCTIDIDEKNDTPLKVSSTINLPFLGRTDMQENFLCALHLSDLGDAKFAMQHRTNGVIYEVDFESNETPIKSTVKLKHHPNIGLDCTPIGFDSEKNKPFFGEKLYGYCYRTDGVTETAIIPKYMEDKTIEFTMYTW